MSALATSLTDRDLLDLPFLLVLIPVAVSLRYAPRFLAAARLTEERSLIERRAETLDRSRARLRRSISHAFSRPFDDLCDRLISDAATGPAEDDIAVLALRIRE